MLKVYEVFTEPHGLPIGEEYIIKGNYAIFKYWAKVCRRSDGEVHTDFHRVDGPARTWSKHSTRTPQWWVEGVQAETFQHFQEMTGCSDADIVMYKLQYGPME
jgi:hypothetical protein